MRENPALNVLPRYVSSYYFNFDNSKTSQHQFPFKGNHFIYAVPTCSFLLNIRAWKLDLKNGKEFLLLQSKGIHQYLNGIISDQRTPIKSNIREYAKNMLHSKNDMSLNLNSQQTHLKWILLKTCKICYQKLFTTWLVHLKL